MLEIDDECNGKNLQSNLKQDFHSHTLKPDEHPEVQKSHLSLDSKLNNSMTFKPLIDSSTGLFCHLLTIKTDIITKIIVDCGIGPTFDYSIYTEDILNEIRTSDCILITSFDISHFGAIGLFTDMKVYCSVPTATLGKIMLDNAHSKAKIIKIKKINEENSIIDCTSESGKSQTNKEDAHKVQSYYHSVVDEHEQQPYQESDNKVYEENYTSTQKYSILEDPISDHGDNTIKKDDVSSDFFYPEINQIVLNDINVTMIKYCQPFRVKNIEICAYNAGCIVGNCLYKIQSNLDTISIGYNFNHRKENYLDGLSSSISSDTIISNSKYTIPGGPMLKLCELDKPIDSKFNNIISHSNRNNILLKERDEDINGFIKRVKGKVIISICMSRLIELLLVIKTGIYVVSNINIMDRVRSMAEWAGSRSSILFDLNITFGKIDGINKKVIIVANDYGNSAYLGNVLNKFHGKHDALIIVNSEQVMSYFDENYQDEVDATNNDDETVPNSCINRKPKISNSPSKTLKFPIYEFKYEWIRVDNIVEVRNNIDCTKPVDNKNWYETASTIFDKLGDKKFPPKNRILLDNDYGEPVVFDFDDVLETEIQPSKPEEVEVETILDAGQIIEISNPCYTDNSANDEMIVYFYNFLGVSDLRSIKTAFEGFSPKQIVVVPDNIFSGSLFHSSLALDRKYEIYSCLNEISIALPRTIRQIKISDGIAALPYKKIGSKRVVLEKCRETDLILSKYNKPEQHQSSSECIRVDENHPMLSKENSDFKLNVAISQLNPQKLKNELIKNNFYVEIIENELLVEEKLKITFKQDKIFVESEENDLLVAIRDILYTNVAIL